MSSPPTQEVYWQQLRYTVSAEIAERLTVLLEAFGADAVTTENAGADEFYEVAFPGTPSWRTVHLTALFAQTADVLTIRDTTLKALAGAGATEVPNTLEKLQDQDWVRVWLDTFKPTQVGEQLWVVPTWMEPVDPAARNIRLDPGLAFGTGTHATTFMCLDWISRQNLGGQMVLDYGSGSGILAIAAIMAGATHADAVDIDPLANDACRFNASINHISEQSLSHCVKAYLPHELPARAGGYALVIANILAEVILALKDLLTDQVSPAGTLLLTGILKQQAAQVMRAYEEQFDFTIQEKDHWVLLIGQRRQPTMSASKPTL